MTTPTSYPAGLTPFEELLYIYITNPNSRLIHPLDLLDEESVYFTAAHGPRVHEEAQHIIETPHLLRLLKKLWQEEPPTKAVLDKLETTPGGRDLKRLAL